MFKHILLPTDGSGLSDRAVKQAVKLAKAIGAKITALYVMPAVSGVSDVYDLYVDEGYILPASLKRKIQEGIAERSREILGAVCAAAATAGIECEGISVGGGSPYEAIIKQAGASKCDLIIMASHGRRGLQGILLGSETQKVLTHSKIPVLVCR